MSQRNLRHKTVPVYDDDEEVQDEIDGLRSYDVQEKLASARYDGDFLLDLNGEDLTFERIQKMGFTEPIRIKQKQGLGLIVPEDPAFNVSDVRAFVGSRRMVDVMECKTQRALVMPMRDFERYFLGTDRKKIYNVISLEFSHTRLENFIKRPTVVDSLDWIDLVWPQHLKSIQTDQTNVLHSMKYPKVQKYCLMSVAGCYTDFHIDFGGTSVWYHILKGGKIFWLIPPTETNIALFERWTLSGSQGDTFLGDIVKGCQRVELEAGNSLMIPSGWIHAVYTPKDSLVFGGNFLNSFNIPMQIRISQLEERLKVPNRFRFPFFTDVLWYALERYVHTFTGVSYLNEEYREENKLPMHNKENSDTDSHVHLTPFEYKGLDRLIEELDFLYTKSPVTPEGIITPLLLFSAGKELLEAHLDDDPALAVTGKPKASWPLKIQTKSATPQKSKPRRPSTNGSVVKSGAGKLRRIRCKECVGCLSDDCRECVYCKDMKKFGGKGTLKQSCVKRKCQNPMFSSSSKQFHEANMKNNVSIENVSPSKRKSNNNPENAAVAKKAKTLVTEISSENGKGQLPIPAVVISRVKSCDLKSNGTSEVMPTKVTTPSSELPLNNGQSQIPIPAVVISRVTSNDLIKYTSKQVESQSLCKSEVINSSLQHNKDAWTCIFKYLQSKDLENCKLVCKDFLSWCCLCPSQTDEEPPKG